MTDLNILDNLTSQRAAKAKRRAPYTYTQKPGVQASMPSDPKSLPYVLWQILDGESGNLSIKEAAGRLNLRATNLSAVLHGRQKISQKLITQKKWREAFAHYYSDTWRPHQETFERLVLTLKPKPGGTRTHEPIDKDSLGYFLWFILGGEQANIATAATRLKTSCSYLSGIIHGHITLSSTAIIFQELQATLAKHYPKGWMEFKNDFEQRMATIKSTSNVKPRLLMETRDKPCEKKRGITRKRGVKAWHDDVGDFMKRVIDYKGYTIDDIIPDIKPIVLKKKETWKRLLIGDRTLSETIFRDALIEICRIYNLAEGRPKTFYQKAQKLITPSL